MKNLGVVTKRIEVNDQLAKKRENKGDLQVKLKPILFEEMQEKT